MKFQEAVELLVTDKRAEYMYRKVWALYSDKVLVYDNDSETIVYKDRQTNILNAELVLATDWVVKFINDKSSVSIQLENAIQRTIDTVEKIYEGCSFDSSSYKYESVIRYFDTDSFEFIKSLLMKCSISMHSTTWGFEFKNTGLFISVYERSSTISILSNNEKAVISNELFFSHNTKKFYTKLRDPAPPRD